jgi:hypothetical protein
VVTARRGFLKTVAIAPLAPGALVAVRESTAAPPSPPETVAEALSEAVRREHGAHIDAEGLARVKKEIANSLDAAARLRQAARLANADEPVTLFRAVPPGAPEGSSR